MIQKANVEEILEVRYFAYMVLQSIFGTEPTPDQYNVLKEATTRTAFEIIGTDPAYQEKVKEFFSYIEENDYYPDIVDEYTRLFIGPLTLPAPPWESIYTYDEPLLLVESTIEVRKAYLAQGYAPKLFPNVADDHISLELDFMKRLALSVLEALGEGNTLAVKDFLNSSKAFLEDHLLKWTHQYCEDLGDSTEGYYKRAADLLATFVKNDSGTIDALRDSCIGKGR